MNSTVCRFRKRGATVLEMIVYMVLFAMLLGGLMSFITWYRNANSGMQRLDVLHQLRVSAFQISEEISYGSQIIFPPNDSSKTYHQIAFKNNFNEIIVIFLNEKEQLMLYNLMKKSRGQPYMKTLTANTLTFDVKRPGPHYVEYELTIRDEKGKDFHLANSARLRNVLK